MKEERLKKEKQDMLGFYDYTVVLTYISLAVSVFGMTRALEGDFKVAILCLALSGLCDMFDGKIARTKKNRTEDEKKFGIQIDSLCDVVCFGVFPAMICYCLGMNHIPGVIILCLYCVASVIRLGYFNVMEEKRQNETSELRHYYQGLPITSMAIILPFLYPEKKWDFRLKWVLSISVSGHKFGLVYPGLGWVCWKGKEYLPEEMAFSVNYLGANITQVGLNFSRPAAQILGQYYQFIRLGFQGYKEVQYNSLMIAKYIHDEIAKMAPFVNYSEDVVNPLFIWYLKPEYAKAAKWTLYDLQDKLSQHGWMVPAYTLPSKLEDYVVMRVVVRQGFSRDMADMLLGDINNAVAELEKLDYPTPTRMAQEKNLPVETKMFNHGGRRYKTVK